MRADRRFGDGTTRAVRRMLGELERASSHDDKPWDEAKESVLRAGRGLAGRTQPAVSSWRAAAGSSGWASGPPASGSSTQVRPGVSSMTLPEVSV